MVGLSILGKGTGRKENRTEFRRLGEVRFWGWWAVKRKLERELGKSGEREKKLLDEKITDRPKRLDPCNHSDRIQPAGIEGKK